MPVTVIVRFAFWLWFSAAVAAGHFLLLRRMPPLALPALTLALAALLVVAYLRIRALREWVDDLQLRSLVLVHVSRFIGIYLLVLYQRGELPRAFAVPAGIGEIVVATMALPVVFAPIEAASRARAIAIWNVVGLVDLLLVMVTTARLISTGPAELRLLTQLPLCLLPTLLLPLLLATHVVIFVRAARERQA
jgi:hypothetical protein